MNKYLRYILIVLAVLWIGNKLFLLYLNMEYSKEEIDHLFRPVTSTYGVKILYEIEDDFFSPLENPPIPAGPIQGSKVERIRHRVLLRYPTILLNAFEKYPIDVIKKHLNTIYFSREINADGLQYGGTYDPFRHGRSSRH